jgi:hypothetical protein
MMRPFPPERFTFTLASFQRGASARPGCVGAEWLELRTAKRRAETIAEKISDAVVSPLMAEMKRNRERCSKD